MAGHSVSHCDGAGFQVRGSIIRVEKRGEKDRIEQESLDFFARIRDVFIEKMKTNAKGVVIDASMPLADVTKTIEKALTKEFIDA